MKKYFYLCILSIFMTTISNGQRLVIGEKAPDIKVAAWLSDSPENTSKYTLLEFFHSSSRQCEMRLPILDKIASGNASRLTVVLLCREAAEKIETMVVPDQRNFNVGIDDDGRTFVNYGVQFVPFCVITDRKGKVIWFGNSSSLDEIAVDNILR